ncbi:MAG: hypothetical protein WB558_25045 [Terriglobales bacterium]
MSMNGGVIADWHPEPWPSVYFKGLRLWDTGTMWFNLNPGDGVYDWSQLDKWLAAAGENGNDVVYTFAGVPQWVSSNPDDNSCLLGPGTCDPPDDLNADGTGTDQHWKDFVTALAEHSENSATAHISFWEMWNEPMHTIFWNGTYAQLIRMVSDAYGIIKGIDPNAVVLSHGFGWQSTTTMAWMGGYFAAGAGPYADAISVHGYCKNSGGTYGPPENVVKYSALFRAVLQQQGQEGKPIWDLEGNWGPGLLTDPDMQAGWLARFYLFHVSEDVKRMYWFLWNGGDTGGLWIPDPQNHSDPGTLLKPGIAYREVGNWVIGTELSSQCSAQGTVWTCGFTGSGGYQALAVWDASGTCSNGECTITKYYFSGDYVNYRTLYGHTLQISGDWVPIGARPILLQNQ